MRTQDEIVIEIRNQPFSLFGTVIDALASVLDFEHVKEFLKDDAKESDWTQATERTKEALLAEVCDYLPFAWDKANGCRGLSAGRSLEHFWAWFWLMGDDELCATLEDYTHYGKPQLVVISEKVGFDWRAHDDNRWVNCESEDEGLTADVVLGKSAK